MTTTTETRPVFPASDMVRRGEHVMERVCQRPMTCTSKSQLRLSIGDPTYDGNLVVSEEFTAAMKEYLHVPQVHGYQRSWGAPAACDAVAAYWGKHFAGEKMAAACKGDNVVISCGVCEALMLTMTALLNPGDNVLIPAPAFSYYTFTCDTFGFEKRFYHMDPNNGWELDINEARQLVDERTKAIVLTNPSNPCGSSWSRQHLQDIIAFAEEFKIPIISDEIYAGLVYSGEEFVSLAAFDTPVPRFIVGGLSKAFMVPGWRCGWMLLMDRDKHAQAVLKGMQNLSTMNLGPNALVQKALPRALASVPPAYTAANMEEIERNAKYFMNALARCPGLSCPAAPQGALYVMVKIDLEAFPSFSNDEEFYMALEDEENVQVVPGTYMCMPGFFRVVITRPAKIIEEVMQRLQAFCERHRKK